MHSAMFVLYYSGQKRGKNDSKSYNPTLKISGKHSTKSVAFLKSVPLFLSTICPQLSLPFGVSRCEEGYVCIVQGKKNGSRGINV